MTTEAVRLILLGNAGSGKSTLARRLIGDRHIPRLSLDTIAWGEGVERKPYQESVALLEDFLRRHEQWVIEGVYGDLVAAALPHCTELRFLNPGIEACVAHCLRRPWEPEKFPSPGVQQAMLVNLVAWVRQYEARTDEYGLARHRALFDGFEGRKREYTRVDDYLLEPD